MEKLVSKSTKQNKQSLIVHIQQIPHIIILEKNTALLIFLISFYL